jgi:hypothetical protein
VWLAGAREPIIIEFEVWQLRAAATLLGSRPDVAFTRRIKEACALRSDDEEPWRSLVDAGEMVERFARSCRDARWNDRPPYRIESGLAPQPGRQDGLVFALGNASAAVQHFKVIEEFPPLDGVGGSFVQLAARYPNVSPRVEARNAADGFTAAEFLVHTAAYIVEHTATVYDAAVGRVAEVFKAAAREARPLARAARLTIEEGVLHTLNGRGVRVEPGVCELLGAREMVAAS